MEKLCIKCNTIKPISEFHKYKRSKDGFLSSCIVCKKLYHKMWRTKNIEKVRDSSRRYVTANWNMIKDAELSRKYGITLEQFNIMLDKQNHLCAICRKTKQEAKRWHVDHCHTTKIVRGILCSNCNTALGLLKENTQSIKNMLYYLNPLETMLEA